MYSMMAELISNRTMFDGHEVALAEDALLLRIRELGDKKPHSWASVIDDSFMVSETSYYTLVMTAMHSKKLRVMWPNRIGFQLPGCDNTDMHLELANPVPFGQSIRIRMNDAENAYRRDDHFNEVPISADDIHDLYHIRSNRPKIIYVPVWREARPVASRCMCGGRCQLEWTQAGWICPVTATHIKNVEYRYKCEGGPMPEDYTHCLLGPNAARCVGIRWGEAIHGTFYHSNDVLAWGWDPSEWPVEDPL